MNNNPKKPTTRYGTTIYAIFRNTGLDTLESRSLFTYFSYHIAIVSFLEDSDVHPTIDNELTDMFINTHLHFHCNMNE